MLRRRRPWWLAAASLALGLLWLAWYAGRSPEPPPPVPREREQDGAGRPVAPAPGAQAAPAAPPAHAPSAPAPAAERALFEGRLVSAGSLAGIPDGELTFSRSGEATVVRTRPDGGFRLDAAPGRWTLAAASAPGHLPFAPPWGHSPVHLDARPGTRVGGLTVALAPWTEHVGLVLAPGGRPVAGAQVRILGGAPEGAPVALRDRFTTDAAGEFRFAAADGAVLEARHPGFGPATARLDLSARGTGRVTITLLDDPSPGATRAGRVEDPTGQPVAGALVSAAPERRRERGPARQATTDDAGRFALADVPPGRYTVVASAAPFADAARRGVAAGGDEVVLRLAPGGAVEGRVRDPGGGPVPVFTISIRPRGRGGRAPPRAVAVVDADGRYRLEGLAPGPSLIAAAAPRRAPAGEVEVVVPEAGAPPATADFVLAPGARVEGVVVDARTHAPLAGARVEVEGLATPGPSALLGQAGAASGADGRFELSGVPEGPLSLEVAAVGHHPRLVGGVTAREGAPGRVTIGLTPLADGEDPRLELAGIGAVLAPRREAAAVVSVVAGGGAAEAGLAPGDEVTRVDGQPIAELGFAAAVDLIRGPEESTVVLGVRKRGDPQRTELRVVVVRRLVRD